MGELSTGAAAKSFKKCEKFPGGSERTQLRLDDSPPIEVRPGVCG